MSVSKKDTEYVANLARLGLTEEEKDLYTGQLNEILGYIDVINKAKTENIAPSVDSAFQHRPTPMRDDIAISFKDTGAILKNAPRSEENMFWVPRIMDGE